MSNTKNITSAISITAIVIALIAIAIALQNTTQPNNQNTLQTGNNLQHYVGVKKEFYLFNSDIPDFNETQMGMPHNVYSIPTMIIYKDDKVTIHFFNTEEPGGDNHSFTISSVPYNINVIVHPGENKTITFDANTTGTFDYYCTFHQPTMRGQIMVLAPPY